MISLTLPVSQDNWDNKSRVEAPALTGREETTHTLRKQNSYRQQLWHKMEDHACIKGQLRQQVKNKTRCHALIGQCGRTAALTRRESPGGGGSPYTRYTRVCHFRGRVLEDFALHKGLLLQFCLTKGSLFSLKSALQQGPFLLKFKVSALKMHILQTSTVKIFESLPKHTF